MAPTLRTAHLLLRPARVRAELIEPDDDVTVTVIDRAVIVAGAVQCGEEEDPMYRHASIDFFVGASARGAVLGPEGQPRR